MVDLGFLHRRGLQQQTEAYYYLDFCLSALSWGYGAEAEGNIGAIKVPYEHQESIFK